MRHIFERLHGRGQLRLRHVLFRYAPCTGESFTDVCVRRLPGVPRRRVRRPVPELRSLDRLRRPDRTAFDTAPEDPVEPRGHLVLVLPLDEHREALTAYSARQSATVRPGLAQVCAVRTHFAVEARRRPRRSPPASHGSTAGRAAASRRLGARPVPVGRGDDRVAGRTGRTGVRRTAGHCGAHWPRLVDIKERVDPDGSFTLGQTLGT
ncbi:hypothetical protein ACFVJ8_12195 [Streptomyces yangpuensis]|uniref:hypothetical protein n=1 Tax=Streptomyces yangpuensis TaxID=1648182 RepID=UPI003625EC29